MLVFAYGSNINSDQMLRRCPRAKLVGPLTLPKGRLVFRGVADIVYDKDSTIDGVVWRISRSDEEYLDACEGVHKGVYKKKFVKLSINHGGSEPCLYYKMADVEGVGPPIVDYYNTILAGYRAHGLDVAKLDDAVNRSWSDKNLTRDIRRRRRRTTSPIKRRVSILALHVTPDLAARQVKSTSGKKD